LEAVKSEAHALHESLKSQNKLQPETTYEDNNLMKEVIKYSDATYKSKVGPSLTLPKELGNSYCGSLYTGLLSLVASHADAAATSTRACRVVRVVSCRAMRAVPCVCAV